MNDPTFTIAVTVFGREELIPRILFSALCQNYKSWDLLFLADGHHPAAFRTLEDFADKRPGLASRISWEEYPARPGAFGNYLRRAAIERAKGDYTAIVGHDCLMDRRFLEHHARNIRQSPVPSLSLVQIEHWSSRVFHDPMLHLPEGQLEYHGVFPREGPGADRYVAGQIDLTCMAFHTQSARALDVFPLCNLYRYDADYHAYDRMRHRVPIILNREGPVAAHF